MRRVSVPVSLLVLLALAGLAGACSSSSPTSRRAAASSTLSSPPGSSRPASTASAGCSRSAIAPGTTDRTLESRGVARKYQLIVPASYTGRKPFPLILGLHALTVSYTFVPSMTGFGDMAKKYDFIGVAPSGRIDGATPYWLAAPSPNNYDLAFIKQLLDHLESVLCIDTARVYSTGMSNGAQMSSLLACDLPNRVTAVAPVAGAEFYKLCDGRPVAVIAFHGRKDPIVTYDGGGLNSERIGDADYWKGKVPKGLPAFHGVDAAMKTWAAHNGCDASPRETRVAPHVLHRVWQHCRAATELYVVEDGGHAWPGKPVPAFEQSFGKATTEIDASTLIFKFFLGAPKQGG